MKSYREIADSVFARREQYIIAQRKKKQAITRATVSVGSVALVSLAGFALWGNDAFHDAPPVTDGGVTATTAKPNVTTTANPTTHGGTDVTTAPTSAATAPSASTETSVSATTPSRTGSTVTATAKKLIAGSEYDDFLDVTEESSWTSSLISYALQAKMEMYRDADVVYAVNVRLFISRKEYSQIEQELGVKENNETLLRLSDAVWLANDEYWDAAPDEYEQKLADYYSKREKYVKLHSEVYGNVDEISNEIIRAREKREMAGLAYLDSRAAFARHNRLKDCTDDELSALRKDMELKEKELSALVDAFNELVKKAKNNRYADILEQRFCTLENYCDTEPKAIRSSDKGGTYYVELSAEAIRSLVEEKGYIFLLATYDNSLFDE